LAEDMTFFSSGILFIGQANPKPV